LRLVYFFDEVCSNVDLLNEIGSEEPDVFVSVNVTQLDLPQDFLLLSLNFLNFAAQIDLPQV
jgi:hypothetical protein